MSNAITLYAACKACEFDNAEAACHRLEDLRITPDGEPYCDSCWDDSPYDQGSWIAAPTVASLYTRSIPTPPPAAEAGEREAFEAAYNRDWRGSAIGIFRERNGEYAYEKWEHAWWAWQARTSLLPTPSYQDGVEAALAAQPATAEDPNESTYQRGRFDGIMEYAAAILALTPSTAGKETT